MPYSFFFYFMTIILAENIFPAAGMSADAQEDIPRVAKEISEQKKVNVPTIWGITEDQLDQLFENSSDYVVLTGEHQICRVNKKWTESLGWTAEELTSIPFVEFLHPNDISSTKGAVDKGVNVGCIINFENRYRTRKGDYHLIQWFALRQVAGTNRRAPILAIGKDLTLERQAQDQKYALQQAETANRLKSAFVAHMSHEIRTPLNGVTGFLDLALEENPSETIRSHLQNARESSHFLLELANDIIDVSKIEANVLKIEQVDFNPLTAINSALSLLSLQAKKKNLLLKSFIDPALPAVLRGDENRLKQILFNLIGNAIKFTAQGNVSLKIGGQYQDGPLPSFLLRGLVKDTGIGIDSSYLPQLFQPFSQVDHSMRRQFGGAGLGLYITRQLCERMGGDIQVVSAPGLGTTFQFYVLFSQPSPSLLTADTKPDSPFILLKELPALSKILVVEDNLMNQKVLTMLLKKLGYEVDIAENGQKGLEAVSQKVYGLVLMDGEMPVMDGLEATREIRRQFSSRQLPIIGVSAHAMSTHRDIFLSAGMNGYLAKPITKDTLVQEIIRCFKALSGNITVQAIKDQQ